MVMNNGWLLTHFRETSWVHKLFSCGSFVRVVSLRWNIVWDCSVVHKCAVIYPWVTRQRMAWCPAVLNSYCCIVCWLHLSLTRYNLTCLTLGPCLTDRCPTRQCRFRPIYSAGTSLSCSLGRCNRFHGYDTSICCVYVKRLKGWCNQFSRMSVVWGLRIKSKDQGEVVKAIASHECYQGSCPG